MDIYTKVWFSNLVLFLSFLLFDHFTDGDVLAPLARKLKIYKQTVKIFIVWTIYTAITTPAYLIYLIVTC